MFPVAQVAKVNLNVFMCRLLRRQREKDGMTDRVEMTYGGWAVGEVWVSVADHSHFSLTARSQQRDTDEDSERRHLMKENNTHWSQTAHLPHHFSSVCAIS